MQCRSLPTQKSAAVTSLCPASVYCTAQQSTLKMYLSAYSSKHRNPTLCALPSCGKAKTAFCPKCCMLLLISDITLTHSVPEYNFFFNCLELSRPQLLFFAAEKYRSSMKLILRLCVGNPERGPILFEEDYPCPHSLCRDNNRSYCHQAVSIALSNPTGKFPADTTPLKPMDFHIGDYSFKTVCKDFPRERAQIDLEKKLKALLLIANT